MIGDKGCEYIAEALPNFKNLSILYLSNHPMFEEYRKQ